jgi:hypothetical protein
MGFFEKSSGGELPPAGTYYAKLAEVKIEQQADYNNPEQMTPRAKWVWETTSLRRSDGKPVLIFDWTGVRYGNPKAGLTKRLDSIFPKLTDDQRSELTPDQMIGRKVQIELIREKSQKGEPKNTIALIKPVKELPQPDYLPDESDDDEDGEEAKADPFADD